MDFLIVSIFMLELGNFGDSNASGSEIYMILAGGSLRSPPTRNTAKYCIYIIILSILCAKELIFYIPQEASRCSAPYRHRKMTYIVRKRILARCGRAVRAKRDFFSWINFFCQDGSNEVSHVHGRVREVCLQSISLLVQFPPKPTILGFI